MTKWMLRQCSVDVNELARRAGIDSVLARVLAVRGYRTAEDIKAFLEDTADDLEDPLLMADMAKALALTEQVVERQIPCGIFGDYDADGIMSTIIMIRTMRALGVPVTYHIPSREGEGYGLNNEAIKSLAEQGVKVIFACDNGISSHEQVEYAMSLGLEVVVIDHHTVTVEVSDGQPVQLLPAAAAVVDPKRIDCPYPFKHYCAAALCYRFSQALFTWLKLDWEPLGRDLLPLATIASVCDIVELVGENRSLVKQGLPTLQTSAICGLQALLEAVQLKDTELDTYHVGFILGPCINASGRLDTASLAVELFMAEDKEQAALLAARLVELNQLRRSMTEDGYQDAMACIEENELLRDKVLVLHCPGIPESVAGIIAGRIKEKYNRPVIVFGGDGETLRGSGRSIEGYNIYEALHEVRELLLSYGGHTLAAGLSLPQKDVELLRQRLNEQCNLSDDDLQPAYRIDCALPMNRADLGLAQALGRLSPLGKGNETPVFADRGLLLESLSVLGKTERVLRWRLRHPSGASCEAIDFHGKDELQEYIIQQFSPQVWEDLLSGKNRIAIPVDVLYCLSVNNYNNRQSARVQIIDFRTARP